MWNRRQTRSVGAWLLATLLAGCSGNDKDAGGNPKTTATVDATVVMSPVGDPTPLSWIATFSTTELLTVDATFDDGVKPVKISGTSDAAPFLVNGLRPATTYTATFHVSTPEGVEADLDGGTFTTDPLPADFPQITVHKDDPADMEPGYTLFLIRPYLTDSAEDFLVALDDEGQVVWYLLPTADAVVTTRFPDDTLVSVKGNPGAAGGPIERFTLQGDLLGVWNGTSGGKADGQILCDGAPGWEHDVAPNPLNGNWVSLMKEDWAISGQFPTSYNLPITGAPAHISADTLFEFDPNASDCAPQTKIQVATLLDPLRIGFDSLDLESPDDDNLFDWGHGNAVWVDPTDGGYVVSLRNQDAVVKIRDGQLVWILGNHDNWHSDWLPYLLTPVGTPFEWQYHQHSPQLSPAGDGHIIIMDNGDYRASPFTGAEPVPVEQQYSRVVEYMVDEAAHTVEQTWDFRTVDGGSVYSPFVGDADYLTATNHILVTWGYLAYLDGVANADRGVGDHAVRIMEVDYATQDVLFDVEMTSPATDPGWTTYRSQRVPSLYEATSPVHETR